jgi:hypothetical protein
MRYQGGRGAERRLVKTVSAEEFELNCLRMIDLVEEKGFAYVITKDGRPIARMESVRAEPEALGVMN